MTPRLAPSTLASHSPADNQRQPFPKRSPRQARAWLGPLCVAVSLAAHGALLVLAMPDPSTETPPADAIAEQPAVLDDVAITVLPKAAPVPEPEPKPKPAPIAEAAPPAVAAPSAAVPQSMPQLTPQTPAIAPVEPPSTPPAVDPEPAFAPPPAAADPAPPALYANFPHLDGAQAACEGLADCWRSPVSSSWRGAASDLKERLEAQGYTLNNVTGDVLSIDSG
ncbi:MAG: hypothetical protein WA939_21445, partial [Nodosilinea sp.]